MKKRNEGGKRRREGEEGYGRERRKGSRKRKIKYEG